MEELQYTKIGDICDINRNTYELKEDWPIITYLDTGNLVENKVSCLQDFYTSKDKLPSRARRKVSFGDILFSTVRPNQRHYGIIENDIDNLLVSTGFAVLSPDKNKVDNYYLYYYLIQDTIIDTLQTIAEQSVSAYPSIKPSDIGNIDILLPPIDVQRKIGHLLNNIDKKIAINNKINDNLAA